MFETKIDDTVATRIISDYPNPIVRAFSQAIADRDAPNFQDVVTVQPGHWIGRIGRF